MQQEDIQTAINYKKNIAAKFMLVEGAKLGQYLVGQDYCVTLKVDGHLQCLFYHEGEVFMLNSQGRERASGLKCLDAFGKLVRHAGLKSAIFAAELYMPRDEGRPRCGDVSTALADDTQRDKLCLAVFDIIQLDTMPWQPSHYSETYDRLTSILTVCSGGTRKASPLCRPVDMRKASSLDQVKAIYDEWVVGKGAEGLVVHSESHIVWKVKPRHTIDAVIVGYTTGDRGVRDLMMAVRHQDGRYQMFAMGSNGLGDDDRASLLQRLEGLHAGSQYVLSDSRGIAYQMVAPQVVYEVSVIELVARGNDDKVRTNPLLAYDDKQGWLYMGMVPGVSALGLTFVRQRRDKTAAVSDVRVTQLTDLCPFQRSGAAHGQMPKTEVLVRRVFRKLAGDKVMLHKFLVLKTNKESSGRYPSYILYHTDYSSSRKEMLKRDMAYSNDRQQVLDMLQAGITANVKKGWDEI